MTTQPAGDQITTHPPSLLAGLPALLRWDVETDLLGRVSDVFLDELSTALSQALGGILRDGASDAQSVLDRLSGASGEAFMRVLTAPDTCARLSAGQRSNRPQVKTFLEDALDAELLRTACIRGEAVSSDGGLWTALADWYFPARSGITMRDATGRGRWMSDELYRAPVLSNGITVDLASPGALSPDLDGFDEPPLPFDEVVLDDVLAQLDEAVATIGVVSPSAAQMLQHFTKVLVLRNVPAMKISSSASSSPYVGRSVILNPQLMTSVELVETLVHEAMHSVLFIIDLRQRFASEDRVLFHEHARSPWSGAKRNIATYIHACFVWFGLWRFWILALEAEAFPSEGIQARLDYIERGFCDRSVVEPFARPGIRETLQPELADIVVSMTESVRQMRSIPAA